MSTATPERVARGDRHRNQLRDLDSLMPPYESEAAFATQPGSLAPGAPGIREALSGFITMNGTLDLAATGMLEAHDLAL
jgi:hypothetical protein